MKKKKTVEMQNDYMDKFIKNLPVLRAATNMTQALLADNVGVSRQTVVAIETRRRPLPWTLYLAMVCVFQNNENSKNMIESFELFDKDFICVGVEND